MNVTIPKWLHVALYFASVLLTAVLYLASKGDVVLTGSAATLLGLLLSVINSVDPETVLSKASPKQLEEAAKRLPPEALSRLSEYQKLRSVSEPPAAP